MEAQAEDSAGPVEVTAEMVEEERKMHEVSMREESALRKQTANEYNDLVERQRMNRLKFLLDKTSVYSKFLAAKLEQQQREKREKEQRGNARAASKAVTGEASTATAPPTTRNMRSGAAPPSSDPPAMKKEKGAAPKRRRSNNYQLEDYISSDDVARAQAASSTSDEMETDEPEVVVSERQPSIFTGGNLREYQLRGMEWMVSLFENGLNGILADEMGLGKTVQCIAFLAYLREKGVWGPFLIVAPLSTLSNWVAEFRRFVPSVNVLLYHGSIDERAKLRAKRMKHLNESFPVIVTSYEIVMNDRKYLQRYKWKYIIVDEGHRIKNLNCRLIRELKSYHSANRMLLTGTPLQNNLAELWSLLNFLLPDIFDDLDSFQRWFDFSDVDKKEGEDRILEAESKDQVVSKLHQILQPFLLRRLKQDVERDLPKKREYLIYAPLTATQRAYYDAAVQKEIRRLLLARSSSDASTEELVEEAPLAPAPDTDADAATAAALAATDESRRLRSKERKDYKELTDAQFYRLASSSSSSSLSKPSASPSKSPSSRKRSAEQAETEDSALAKEYDEADESNGARVVNSLRLQNVMMQLRKVCNHPYLFDFPMMPNGEDPRIDEELVTSSGKMLVLDRLLPALLQRGHRVLIFSQMTRMLDILEEYLDLRSIRYCRIDGTVQQVEREESIRQFNTDTGIGVFLLSTRAGGLGLNLTAADTCIIFDSDWNPQMDLQAQDRVHRIGQTRPVLIYRFCTANTAEAAILERANAKRKLEKLVMHRGRFRQGPGANESSISVAELADIFRTQDGIQANSPGDEVISDRELELILDRSPAAFADDAASLGDRFKLFETSRDEANDVLSALNSGRGSAADTA